MQNTSGNVQDANVQAAPGAGQDAAQPANAHIQGASGVEQGIRQTWPAAADDNVQKALNNAHDVQTISANVHNASILTTHI